YAVYISTTPNPTSGYVHFLDESDVRIIDLPVEDAAKLVISMGLVFPENDESVKMLPAGANIDQAVAQELLEKHVNDVPAPAHGNGGMKVAVPEKPAKKKPVRRKRAAKTETTAK